MHILLRVFSKAGNNVLEVRFQKTLKNISEKKCTFLKS